MKFNPAQENYSTFDMKLLAIMDVLEYFRSVLTGCKFSIVTDHKPLEAFLKPYDLIGKQARWQQIVNQFDCTIERLEADKNVIADAFSRVFCNPSILPSLPDFIPQSTDSTQHLHAPFSTFSLSSSPTVPLQLQRRHRWIPRPQLLLLQLTQQ